ncbi:protein FAM204A [Brachyhypopomus gauderio]|uniref:protein FAM204A n=1 Tax=Brachyhypopomus gauderio TaxID=698409 RepID=UPI0040434170
MYSGLLPKGLDETELSADEDDDGGQNTQRETDRQAETTDQITGCASLCECVVSEREERCSRGHAQEHAHLNACAPAVRPDLWQKFKAIQKEKEVQKMKRPQRKTKRKIHKQKGGTEQDDSEEKRQKAHVKHWKELTQYFGANDRFQPPACSRPPLKSGLERSIENAIAEGDYREAEELSDRLASRELAVKIAQAADSRDFARSKQEEASQAAQRRKNRVPWGFEAKKRWETKSNMGYM